MARPSSTRAQDRPDLAAWLLIAAVAFVALTGGASAPDALGQPLVRIGVALLAAVAIGAGLRFDFRRYRAPALWLAAAALLTAAQLIPLPAGLWRSLPGRAAFDLSALVPDLASVWRPAAIVPDLAWNALFSLVVPAAVLLLLAATPRAQLRWLPPLLVAVAGASGVFAAIQFAGAAPDDPLINERIGYASGLFANRNHQALFLAIGVAAACQWGATRPFSPVRAAVAGVSGAWFLLMLLATGSRAGLALGLIGLAGGAIIVVSAVRREGLRLPRRRMFGLAAGGVLALAGLMALSISAGRSESLSRLNDAAIGEDMRVRALPQVLDLAQTYGTIGAGQGAFATLFKAIEPDALLKPTWFNHAHNDYLELVIAAGVPGVLLLLVALIWLARLVWRAWRAPPTGEVQRARLGSIVILLTLLASATDYPARTPLVMTVLVLAVGWLSLDRPEGGGFTA